MHDNLLQVLRGKTLMIVGAGGTIGAEIATQVAQYEPSQLICLGHHEQTLSMVRDELSRRWPRVRVLVEVADICDYPRLTQIFTDYCPTVVFHTAAYKHIQLTEEDPARAVLVNVGGTLNLVELSSEIDVEHFIFTSSIKAADPVSVMAATKRIGEIIVSSAATRTGKGYLNVRLGNVLESSGGVHTIFRHQIAIGGPVTVTHPDIQRSFTSAAESVGLLLDALLLDGCGNVLALGPGKPIRIADLAQECISECGLRSGKDIEIVYVGLRPGEKLIDDERLDFPNWTSTCHDRIMESSRDLGSPPYQGFYRSVRELIKIAEKGNRESIVQELHRLSSLAS